jgi:hypothetical protein
MKVLYTYHSTEIFTTPLVQNKWLDLVDKNPLLKPRISKGVLFSLQSIQGTNCISSQIFRCILQGKIETNLQRTIFLVSLKGIRYGRKYSCCYNKINWMYRLCGLYKRRSGICRPTLEVTRDDGRSRYEWADQYKIGEESNVQSKIKERDKQ